MPSALPQPERLGAYDIVETLVEAHAGWVVYKGFDPILRRTASLKTIPRKLLNNYGSALIARLENDILIASRLHHPGIVGVYEFGEQGDFAYIASEYVEGPYLRERVRLPLSDAVSLLVQLLMALDFAHSQGVVHRGIKPANLLLNAKGQLRIAHFGVAELDSGTPAYMSPEQFARAPLDKRTDIFSSAVVFYEVLTGAHPFAGPAETLVERITRSAECPPSEVNPELPRAFDRICARALAKAAHDRYPSARSFCEDVREAYEQARGASLTRVLSNEAASYATQVLSVAERELFTASSRDPGRSMASAAVSAWGDETLRKVEKQLAQFIGPVARIRVREAAVKATGLDNLYSLLAEGLGSEEERRAFLAKRSGAAPAPATQVGPDAKPQEQPQERTVARPGPQPFDAKTPVLEPKPAPPPPDGNRKEGRSVPAPVMRPEPVPASPERPPAPRVESKPAAKAETPPARPMAPPPPPPPPKLEPPDSAARMEELIGKQPETLSAYLKDGPPQVEEVILPFVSTVQALIALYATGAKKEALSPQNVTFDRLGKATIQLLPATPGRGTSSAASNPRYAAPEMFAEKAGASADAAMAAAHIYALGVMFYEILLGKKLFAKSFAEQRTELDWMRWHADPESKAPTIKSLLPDYPAALSDLIESMMDKRPEKRPPNLEAILTRLRQIAQRANKTVVLSKKTQEKGAPYAEALASRTPAPAKGHTLLWILLALAVAAAGGGIWLWQNPDFFKTVIAPALHLN
ncbi:MAG TPA: protein kinase [Candidatus Sulfotelmatobacter sp.]|jgi:serine/threonine-protein kinase|nr:protein kinase [Candidatus Sulfotelmatobacter sp.]